MKREEEIKLVASCHIADETSKYQEFYDGFIAGAKWADKTMIDKACEWLQQHQESYDMYDAWSGDFVNFKSLIIDFRKAMEEYSIETIKISDCNPKAQPCVLTNHGIDTNVVKFD